LIADRGIKECPSRDTGSTELKDAHLIDTARTEMTNAMAIMMTEAKLFRVIIIVKF
jgi:hypothetical protein